MDSDSRVAGIKRRSDINQWRDSRYDYWSGTREALIAAGICKPAWFPKKLTTNLRPNGEPWKGKDGQPRTKRTYETKAKHPTTLHHKFDAHGNEKWVVRIAVSDEEEARREKQQEDRWARQEREHDYRRAVEDEEKELAHMPQSHEGYRADRLRWFEHWFEDRVEDFFGESKFNGYSFAPEVLEAVNLKMAEVRSILETGRTVFSASRHNVRLAELKARVAAADPDVRAFLAQVTKADSSDYQ